MPISHDVNEQDSNARQAKPRSAKRVWITVATGVGAVLLAAVGGVALKAADRRADLEAIRIQVTDTPSCKAATPKDVFQDMQRLGYKIQLVKNGEASLKTSFDQGSTASRMCGEQAMQYFMSRLNNNRCTAQCVPAPTLDKAQ